ncbi:MAG: YdeI/OmpD-associated family protein [Paludibacter sp.]|nr:YdeI/OmpD-associated family protein [Paludibacter sp.]
MRNNIQWQEELNLIKSIIRQTELEETIKWGTEVYTYNGKNVVSCGAFKNFLSLWFYNGVFLKDKYNVLVSAQEGKTKALRQWRFTSMDEIDEKKILEYILEAIENEKEGRTWKAEKSTTLGIPEGLLKVFQNNDELKKAFDGLTPYKQKEYTEFIESAKREETRNARLAKIEPMILNGIGLHDKYKK